jgi:tRNA(adenine34) deaminase
MSDEEYMQLALCEALRAEKIDEVPIGAVVVHENQVISSAHNMRECTKDPSAHAEFLAMKQASKVLGAWRLCGCTVFVTVEPCLMCAGLMHQARIKRCVYGAPDAKAGALGSLYEVHQDRRLNHNFEVTYGVCEKECARILSQYFSRKRMKRKKQ